MAWNLLDVVDADRCIVDAERINQFTT